MKSLPATTTRFGVRLLILILTSAISLRIVLKGSRNGFPYRGFITLFYLLYLLPYSHLKQLPEEFFESLIVNQNVQL